MISDQAVHRFNEVYSPSKFWLFHTSGLSRPLQVFSLIPTGCSLIKWIVKVWSREFSLAVGRPRKKNDSFICSERKWGEIEDQLCLWREIDKTDLPHDTIVLTYNSPYIVMKCTSLYPGQKTPLCVAKSVKRFLLVIKSEEWDPSGHSLTHYAQYSRLFRYYCCSRVHR